MLQLIIGSDNYLLQCYLYVELNPVHAGMVPAPGDYEWSSYALNTSTERSRLVPHAVYLNLASDDESRVAAYRALFAQTLSDDDLGLIRTAGHYSQPIGDESFRKRMANRFGIPTGYLSRGRPRKDASKAPVKI